MADAVNHPAHYAPIFEARQIECIEIARYLDFCRGNAFKYVWRAGLKGEPEKAIEDCEKAKFYMARVLDPEMNLPAIAMFRVLGNRESCFLNNPEAGRRKLNCTYKIQRFAGNFVYRQILRN